MADIERDYYDRSAQYLKHRTTRLEEVNKCEGFAGYVSLNGDLMGVTKTKKGHWPMVAKIELPWEGTGDDLREQVDDQIGY